MCVYIVRICVGIIVNIYVVYCYCRGIAALHQYKGVCHRDIKSFNFLG